MVRVLGMNIEVFQHADEVARRAAAFVAASARSGVEARKRFTVAVSGGQTPWAMLRALGEEDVPWAGFHILQVDERVAPAGDPDRNLTQLRGSLLSGVALDPERIHAMPVEARDLEAGASRYSKTLQELAGTPPVLDLVHLGMGPDGHTASLVPQDAVLEVTDAEVGLTGLYQGHRRMTLTYPALNRARQILWLITGEGKADMLLRLRDGDESIPAGRVNREHAVVFADRAAAAKLK
jgi:6-phosphogluconolactonase